ncbi:YceI like family protein [Caballeronia arationis]|jgi:polyisoprenoid-binding protein YceI|uniref:Polyisoprenoid-binding protein YceI n=1 Tax=Caballeronia arationis TaxID=1777142 RepID=A0A7Z7N2I0_9BURK|nr:YceI family protein [Caballeronia arationis]SAK84763.1 YceI like family protein [Caballeronia arationis]SOE61991.1 Polyisoprenoid-binding protein YceI [Caballeronia arationis]
MNNRHALHRARVWAACGALLALMACTPLQVVTHRVSPSEASVPAGRYVLDPHHWNVSFDVDHFHYSRFVIRFDKVAAELDWKSGGIEQSTVSATIDAASVNTNVALLDRLVKGPDMFDAARYPEIRFVSTHFVRTGDDKGTLTGDLTVHGTTRPVTLNVTFNGHAPNPLTKQETLGFSADGHFSRAQFGLSKWYPAVGDDVHVAIQAEFVKAPADAAP